MFLRLFCGALDTSGMEGGFTPTPRSDAQALIAFVFIA